MYNKLVLGVMKMCEFCEGKEKEFVDSGEFYIENGELYSESYGNCFGLTIVLGINYCPMCGRKLEE